MVIKRHFNLVIVAFVIVAGFLLQASSKEEPLKRKITDHRDSSCKDINPNDEEVEQLRNHITSLEANIAKMEETIATGKIQTGLLTLPGLRGSLVGLPCVRIEIEDLPLDAVRYGLTKKNIRDVVEAQFQNHNIETLNPETIPNYSHDQIILWEATSCKPGLHVEVNCSTLKSELYIGYIKVLMKHDGGEFTPSDHIDRLSRFEEKGIFALERPLTATLYTTEWARTWVVYPGTGKLDTFAEDEKNALGELVGEFIEDYLAANPKGFVDYIYGYAGTEDNPIIPWVVIRGQVVHEGDTIDDIKVVKIHPFKHNVDGTMTKAKVEFEKGEKRWTQEEEENPSPEWQ